MSPTADTTEQFRKYFAQLDDDLRGSALSLRDLVRQAAPKAAEALKWGYPTWVHRGNVCSINHGRGYVRLQFFRGVELPDPSELLEGTGKSMRHVKVWADAELPSSDIRALVREAMALNSGA